MAFNNFKNPSVLNIPTSIKQPRIKENPGKNDGETIVWRFGIMDHGGQWGWHGINLDTLMYVIKDMSNFETMKWHEILKKGNHLVETWQICPDAQKRLATIKQDDASYLVSLRLSGKERVWGVRDGR